METSDSAVLGNPLSTFYLAALDLLEAHPLPFLVGGTFAYARYTGIDAPDGPCTSEIGLPPRV